MNAKELLFFSVQSLQKCICTHQDFMNIVIFQKRVPCNNVYGVHAYIYKYRELCYMTMFMKQIALFMQGFRNK